MSTYERLVNSQNFFSPYLTQEDLSRLGRDFVEVGRYTDVVFPSLGCRFVSVLDCLDSEGGNTDMLHFRSLMNDYHLKDLSGKIKSVLHAKMRSGQFIGAYAPYGYRKSEEDTHKLAIDQKAAAVVRRIFELRAGGMAYGKIAATLNNEGIPTPRRHWEAHYGSGSGKSANLWKYATVKNILRNEVYLGSLIQNRTGSRSYKDSTMVYKPETEWICHEAIHEAIIPRELWEEVQEVNRKASLRAEGNATPTPCLFSGKLVCADCKAPLVASRRTQRRKSGMVKQYTSYCCSNFATTGGSSCTRHTIHEITLKELVMGEIRVQAEALELDEAAVLDKLQRQLMATDAGRQEYTRKEITKLRRRVEELEHMTAKLYEDKVCGAITEATFITLMGKSEQERLEKTERLDALLAEVKECQQKLDNIQSWAAVIRKHLHIQELDRIAVDELIDHIEVGESVVVNGRKQRDVAIYYRFVGRV